MNTDTAEGLERVARDLAEATGQTYEQALDYLGSTLTNTDALPYRRRSEARRRLDRMEHGPGVYLAGERLPFSIGWRDRTPIPGLDYRAVPRRQDGTVVRTWWRPPSS